MTTGGKGELRPLDVGESIGMSLTLYSKNAVALWTIAAAVIIPIEIVVTIVRRASLPSGVFLQDGSLYTSTGAQPSTVGILVAQVLTLLGILLATGAVFHLVLDARLGRSLSLGDALAHAGHRLLSLLWLGIVVTVMVTVGFVLIVVPGVWLLVATSVAIPVLMLEGLKGFQAVSRSISLVQGRWWSTFGTLLLAIILYIVALVVALIAGAAIASGTTNVTLYEIVIGAFSALIFIVLAPFWASVVTVLYIDLRVRKEGLVHAMLADRSRAPGSTVPAAAAPTFPGSAPPSDSPTPPPAGEL